MKRLLLFGIFVLAALGLAQMPGMQNVTLLQAGAGYLMLPAVQKEIGLSAAASKKINDKMKSATQTMMQAPPKDPAQRMKVFEARMKTMQKIQGEALKMLTPPQQARLKQIVIQQMGASSMVTSEVKTQLNLTADQQRKIGAIIRDGTQAMFAGMQGSGASKDDFQKRMQEFQKKQVEWKAKMITLSLKELNATQKAKWASIQGKPFKLDMLGGMRGVMGSGTSRRGG